MKLYKLVDQDYTTYNRTMSWELGKTNSVPRKDNPRLCSPDVIHAYRDLNLGLVLNFIHADIENPIVLECEGDIVVEDWDKVGVFELTPIKELHYPKWYKTKSIKRKVLIEFAIVCAESVLHIFEERHPDDKRPRLAIEAAKKVLKNNTKKNRQLAAYAHVSAAIFATNVASYVASFAARAAFFAADVAADAAVDTARASYAAAYAARAYAADADGIKIDFSQILNDIIKKYKDK